jgi:hypothetical protein
MPFAASPVVAYKNLPDGCIANPTTLAFTGVGTGEFGTGVSAPVASTANPEMLFNVKPPITLELMFSVYTNFPEG